MYGLLSNISSDHGDRQRYSCKFLCWHERVCLDMVACLRCFHRKSCGLALHGKYSVDPSTFATQHPWLRSSTLSYLRTLLSRNSMETYMSSSHPPSSGSVCQLLPCSPFSRATSLKHGNSRSFPETSRSCLPQSRGTPIKTGNVTQVDKSPSWRHSEDPPLLFPASHPEPAFQQVAHPWTSALQIAERTWLPVLCLLIVDSTLLPKNTASKFNVSKPTSRSGDSDAVSRDWIQCKRTPLRLPRQRVKAPSAGCSP